MLSFPAPTVLDKRRGCDRLQAIFPLAFADVFAAFEYVGRVDQRQTQCTFGSTINSSCRRDELGEDGKDRLGQIFRR